MKYCMKKTVAAIAILLTTALAVARAYAKEAPPCTPESPGRLPRAIEGRRLAPDLGCFWSYDADEAAFRHFVDLIAPTNAFDALTITTRGLDSIVDNQRAADDVKRVVEYAKDKYGVGALLDIDVRIARYDFEKIHPELSQERIMLQEQASGAGETLRFHFHSPVLSDHYTGNRPYYVRGARFVKAWRYRVDSEGAVVGDSIRDASELVRYQNNQFDAEKRSDGKVDERTIDSFELELPRAALDDGERATVAVAFRYSYPDLFADETLALEKSLYESYRAVPALGTAKDEWGFPPSFERADSLNDFWFSERMRDAYNRRYSGRELVDDLFLAFRARVDGARERIEAIDRYKRLCSDRVLEYELQNYALTKELWGNDAFVGVHCTWFPWPNMLEMRKNGIMWWKAPRDYAQTDEFVPFAVRNSLAKGSDSLWINMFYARRPEFYIWEHWTAAASGGRVHLHSIYPRDANSPTNPRDSRLLPIVEDARVNRIREKIRILNFISNSQLDSPVAVLFSRFGAANPLREEYQKVGTELCDRFAALGYPADLTPIDEIFSTRPDGAPRWTVQHGYLCYGAQPYRVLLLYGASDAERDAYDALSKLAVSVGADLKTRIITLSALASDAQKDAAVAKIVGDLKSAGVVTQVPWTRDEFSFGPPEEISTRPARATRSRFLDGTILWIAAQENPLGDPIHLENEVVALDDAQETPPISADANGVFAAKFNERGEVVAIAGSELKRVAIQDFALELTNDEIGDEPIDVALWRGQDGKWRGVFQRSVNNAPESLWKLTEQWNFLQATTK